MTMKAKLRSVPKRTPERQALHDAMSTRKRAKAEHASAEAALVSVGKDATLEATDAVIAAEREVAAAHKRAGLALAGAAQPGGTVAEARLALVLAEDRREALRVSTADSWTPKARRRSPCGARSANSIRPSMTRCTASVLCRRPWGGAKC